MTPAGGGGASAALSALVLSTGALTPAFDPAVAAYAVSVDAATAWIAVTATASQAGASITAQGGAIASGARSPPIALAPGTTTIAIAVTGAGGASARTYTVVVTRAAPVADGLHVAVEEEVLLDATAFADLGAIDADHAAYAWDFGDGMDDPAEGISVTHAWSRPGTFAVTLTVTPGVLASGTWTFPGPPLTFTRSYVVEGPRPALPPVVAAQPLLELKFDDGLRDTSGHDRSVSWAAGDGAFAPGIDGGLALDVSGGRYVGVAGAGTFLGGLPEFTVSFWARRTAFADPTTHLLGLRDATAGDVLTFSYVDSQSLRALARTDLPASGSAYAWNVARTKRSVWNHYAITYAAATRSLVVYVDGLEEGRQTVDGGALFTTGGDLLLGADGAGGHAFEGWIDDLRIYGVALPARDVTTGFEVRHADLHARTAQPIEVRVPQGVTADPAARLRVVVSGGALGTSELVLLDQQGPAATERCLLRNGALPGSPDGYLLGVWLLGAGNEVLHGKVEFFRKTYDGDPLVGIDENNAVVVAGAPFFPVTPWGLNDADVASWASAGYVNTLYGTAFWPHDLTVAEYTSYLALGQASGMKTIGPSMFAGQRGAEGGVDFADRTRLGSITAYVKPLREHPGVLMWQWRDEPELHGVGAPTVRSWTVASHREDEQHPVATNYMGNRFVGDQDTWAYGASSEYVYERDANRFGRPLHVTDVTGFDYYPVAFAAGGNTTAVSQLAGALDALRERNGGLIPTFSWVETADAVPDDGHAVQPTPAQLEMLVWLNVVHGVKGINWFHYFGDTPAANLAVMSEFTRRMAALGPVVLGPESGVTVEATSAPPARIDTLVKVHDGKLYLLAVRLSEMQLIADGTAVEAIDPVPAQVTFQLAGVGASATVLYEGRTLDVTGGTFSDTFAPFAVHLYELPLQ